MKAWQRDRMEMLIDVLLPLTAADEERIKQICDEEVAYFRARFEGKAVSSLIEPMSDARVDLRAKLPLNDQNSYVNPKTQKREHLALKYLNWSEEEWRAMKRPSDQALKERRENLRFLEDPYAIVEKARELLESSQWMDIAIGLAVVSGRRLTEIMKAGTLDAREQSLYTAMFSGQLKRKDALLKPFEVPLLLPSALVLASWARLRTMIDCSSLENEAISKRYGTELSEAAKQHFGEMVPARPGRGLYFHGFRSVYAAIAILWFCPVSVHDTEYRPAVLGQYWNDGGELERDVAAGLHYVDYVISDGSGNIDGRHGVRLGEPGMKVIDEFNKPAGETQPVKRSKRAMDTANPVLQVEAKGQTEYSMYKPLKSTRTRLDVVQAALAKKRGVKLDQVSHDDVLCLLLDAYSVSLQIEQITSEPVATLAALVQDASKDSKDKPIEYLQTMLKDKRAFKASYEGRHSKTDYATLSTSELKKHKTDDASIERFSRAVAAIIAYNGAVPIPDARWCILPALLVDLVGGAPSKAKEYIDKHPEVAEHNAKYKLTPGINRRGIPVTKRFKVPEMPGGDAFELVPIEE